jgi:Na+-translocating ferredoxin:NAD+ oxidoreductase RnfD subunit
MDIHIPEEIKGLVAGFCGAMVYSVLRKPQSVLGAIGQIVAGMACAYYLSPIIVLYWQVNEHYHYPVAFLVGLFGLATAGGVLWAIERYDFAKLLPGKKVGE